MTTISKKTRTFFFVDNMEKNLVQIFPAGEKEGTPALATFALDTLPATIRDRLALAGLRTVLQQRTSDIDAGPAKLAGMQEVYQHWTTTGEWERPRNALPANRVAPWMPLALVKMRGTTFGIALHTLEDYARKLDKDAWAGLVAKLKPYREELSVRGETIDLSELTGLDKEE